MNAWWTSRRSYELPLESNDPPTCEANIWSKSINYRSNFIFQIGGRDELFFPLPVSCYVLLFLGERLNVLLVQKCRGFFGASEINGNIHHDCDIFHLLDPGDFGRCPAFATCFVYQQNYQFLAASVVIETSITPANSSINHHLWWSVFTTSLPKMCWETFHFWWTNPAERKHFIPWLKDTRAKVDGHDSARSKV